MSFSYKPTCGKVNEGFLYGCSSQSCRNGKGCSQSEPPDDFIGAKSSSYILNSSITGSANVPVLYIIIVFMVIATTILTMSGA
jgi:hypothetical protein